MTSKTKTTFALAASAAATLAVPAVAGAHGSVYETTAKVAANPQTTPPTFLDQQRYVVANHGFTYVLRETNGSTSHGMINYAAAPGALRNQPGFNVLTQADTGAQPHASCNVPALTSEAAIRAWQGTDPFYGYVPFQATAAGLEDSPADWLDDVQTRTGVNLATVAPAGLEAACEALPGATSSSFVKADETQSTVAAFNSGAIAEAEAPLEARVAELEGQLAAAPSGDSSGLQRQLDAAKAENDRLRLLDRPLKLSVPATVKGSDLSGSGLTAALQGPAFRAVSVRIQISELKARRLGLKSRVIGRGTGVLTGAGSGNVQVTLSAAGKAALKKADGTFNANAVATAGDRSVTSAMKVTG